MKSIILISLFVFSTLVFAEENPSRLVVFGEAETTVPSDEWEISFEISLKEKSREAIMAKYNTLKEETYAKLSNLGVKKSEVKTESFSLSTWYEWENNSNVKKGQVLTEGLRIKKDRFELINKIVSALTPLTGINVRGLSHLLKPASREKEMNQLYARAFNSAKTKVDALLDVSGKKFKRYELISEDLSASPRLMQGGEMLMGMSNKSAAQAGERNFQLSLVPLDVPLSMQLKVIANFE